MRHMIEVADIIQLCPESARVETNVTVAATRLERSDDAMGLPRERRALLANDRQFTLLPRFATEPIQVRYVKLLGERTNKDMELSDDQEEWTVETASSSFVCPRSGRLIYNCLHKGSTHYKSANGRD